MNFRTITEYLNYLFEEFQEEIGKMDVLCNLRKVSFEGGNLPDYNDRAQALLYCLRYHFGYAFEYEYIYDYHILEDHKKEEINVLSVGCGNGIDLWALDHAIKRRHSVVKKINYRGIDCVDWIEYFDDYDGYNTIYVQNDVKELLKCDDVDVLIFPKSISELEEKDLEYLAELVDDSTDELFVVASFRSEDYNLNEDINRFDKFIKMLIRNGFTISKGKLNIYYSFKKSSGIRSCYSDYIYPDEVIGYLSDLFSHCDGADEDCLDKCSERYTRMPILKIDHVKYNFVKLKRGES